VTSACQEQLALTVTTTKRHMVESGLSNGQLYLHMIRMK